MHILFDFRRRRLRIMNTDKTILHCDMNGFFASVEMLARPDLAGQPVAVSGDPDLRHGIILAKNEPAKKFGVSTGETIWSARRKCPDLVLLEAHHDLYAKYSRLANGIYFRFTDRVEPFGIDESWLDVSASKSLHGDGKTIADKIRQTIKNELNLTVSVGVSYNKVFAKLASDYKKPDATTVFGRTAVEKIVHKLPVGAMLFVGRSSADALRKMGILTIGDLAACPEGVLVRKFGKHGALMKKYALGEDDSPVAEYGAVEQIKSVGNSITFRRDICGADDIKKGFTLVAEKLSARMRRKGVLGRTLHIVVKRADFSVITRQVRLPFALNDTPELVKSACACAGEASGGAAKIRMLGITCSDLVFESAPHQEDMFAERDEKARKRESVFFDIRSSFGTGAIKRADMLDCDLE